MDVEDKVMEGSLNRMLKMEIALFPIIMFVLQQYIVGPTLFYCIVIGYIAVICFLNRGKLLVPRIIGFRFLVLYQAITIFVGMVSGFSFRNIVRDVFYTSAVVFVLWIGYVYGTKSRKQKNVLYSMVVLAIVLVCVNLVEVALNVGGLNFETLKSIMRTNIGVILLGFIVSYVALFCAVGLTSRLAKNGMILLGVNIILSMSRATIIAALCSMLVVTALVLSVKSDKKNFARVLFVTTVCILLVNISMEFLPEPIVNTFVDKMLYSTQEISAEQSFDSIKEVSNSWRGYEISQAQKLMKEGNIFQWIFGYGAGKQIPVPYLKTLYASTTVSDIAGDTSPLLHNGYYTILVKGGIFGILTYVLFFFRNAKNALNGLKQKFNGYELIVIGFMLVMAVQMYVTRGLAEQTVDWWWCFLIGWINSTGCDKNSNLGGTSV